MSQSSMSGNYADGHVPGAVNVPFDEFRSPADETPDTLPSDSDFRTEIIRHGWLDTSRRRRDRPPLRGSTRASWPTTGR